MITQRISRVRQMRNGGSSRTAPRLLRAPATRSKIVSYRSAYCPMSFVSPMCAGQFDEREPVVKIHVDSRFSQLASEDLPLTVSSSRLHIRPERQLLIKPASTVLLGIWLDSEEDRGAYLMPKAGASRGSTEIVKSIKADMNHVRNELLQLC